MAASVYATPPPDLSSEDTALSDVSNSSQVSSSSSSQSKASKRNIASVLSSSNASSLSAFDPNLGDQSKKRRKQSTPIRISAINLTTNIALNPATDGSSADIGGAIDSGVHISTNASENPNNTNNGGVVDAEQKLPRHIIPMLEQDDGQIQRTSPTNVFEANISSALSRYRLNDNNFPDRQGNAEENEGGEVEDRRIEKPDQSSSILQKKNISLLKCDQCDERFESELRLSVHILQSHAPTTANQRNDLDPESQNEIERMAVKIKPDPDSNDIGTTMESRIMQNMPRPEDWLAMSGLNFPFPPEAAAAALSASNYLSQLPLLGVSSVGAFPSVEGLSRPPLRIFNPEAYCDLCNKEFCNKYFLKTHKANKHGIYDPANLSNESPNSSQINPISQVLQLQLQQQQHQQQQQQQSLQNVQQLQTQLQSQQEQSQNAQQLQLQAQLQSQQEQTPTSSQVTIYCDICHKRFTNVFSMKRHRSKAHEIPPPNGSPYQIKTEIDSMGSNDKENATPFRMPDGFREDFAIEQEDVSFTPQPRKLSPASSQQAREANFSADKLKRLGVINPEAFCDLCCKEYCNKYFLRTHKLKRHGILVPDEPKDEKLPWQFVQSAPLNLIVGGEKIPQKTTDSESSSKSFKSDEDGATGGKISEQDMKDKEAARLSDIFVKNEQLAESNNYGQDPEPISLDLQKLQSMILQLNDLGNQRPIACHLCGKELENKYMLHAHITTEHSSDNNNLVAKSPQAVSPSTSGTSQNEVCKQCDKEFSSLMELKQHIFEVHKLPLNSPIREGFITPERPIATTSATMPNTPTQTDRRPAYTITPTSSYCEICNKELCNKYFMKTHMQRMHGIEIENGAQIGGVVCNICNKELCSKYFLRVHKHNTHGIVDEGSPLPQSRQNGEQPDADTLPFSIDMSIKTELADISSRYFTHYTEVCPLCSRRFRSSKWLRAHLMSDHGKAGTEKLRELEQQMSFAKSSSPTLKIPNGGAGLALNNLDPSLLAKGAFPQLIMTDDAVSTSTPRLKEYQCSICSFSTPYYAFLFIHERSHSFMQNPSPPPTVKSENAVSIAKDNHQRVAQPSSNMTTTSSSGTPTVTPASTPAPQTPQENASGIKREHNRDRDSERERDAERESSMTIASLGDLANLTNRPAAYALPQQGSDCEMMQSFLIEEVVSESLISSMNGGSQVNGTGHRAADNGGSGENSNVSDSGCGENNNSSGNVNNSTGCNGNRFVPALVFLPVRERISGPITVSFTLTPA